MKKRPYMQLIVKDMDIASGSAPIIILNQEDAHRLDLFALDRVKVKRNHHEAIAIVDIAESSKAVPVGKIGFFEEVMEKLNARSGTKVSIALAERPESTQYIKEKLDGKELDRNKIHKLIDDLMMNKLSEIELSYFVAACYSKGLSLKETYWLTEATVQYGDHISFNKSPILDLHCIGGVPGNRTTMIVVPIIAAAGFCIPKTSSRAITSPAGTADTMEVLAKVALPLKDVKKVVAKTNACLIWGGAMNLAGADDKLIKVRVPLSLDPEGLLLSSILAKKSAVSITYSLIDIPVGKNTKIQSIKQAHNLRKKFEILGKKLGITVKILVTDGSEPVGNGIGPLLEVRDILWVLRGDSQAPADLRNKSIHMATLLLEMVHVRNARKKVEEILDSGRAYKKMADIIKAQHGKMLNPNNVTLARFSQDIYAHKTGKITAINNYAINKLARIAGAPKDKKAGLYLHKHVNDFIYKGQKLFTLYSDSKTKVEQAVKSYGTFDGFSIE